MDERVRMLGPLPFAPDLRRALWTDFDVESDPAKPASPTDFPTVWCGISSVGSGSPSRNRRREGRAWRCSTSGSAGRYPSDLTTARETTMVTNSNTLNPPTISTAGAPRSSPRRTRTPAASVATSR